MFVQVSDYIDLLAVAVGGEMKIKSSLLDKLKSGVMKTVTREQQIFKCMSCHLFFRMADKEGDFCKRCHRVKSAENEVDSEETTNTNS